MSLNEKIDQTGLNCLQLSVLKNSGNRKSDDSSDDSNVSEQDESSEYFSSSDSHSQECNDDDEGVPSPQQHRNNQNQQVQESVLQEEGEGQEEQNQTRQNKEQMQMRENNYQIYKGQYNLLLQNPPICQKQWFQILQTYKDFPIFLRRHKYPQRLQIVRRGQLKQDLNEEIQMIRGNCEICNESGDRWFLRGLNFIVCQYFHSEFGIIKVEQIE